MLFQLNFSTLFLSFAPETSYLPFGQDGSLVVIPTNGVESQNFFIFHVLSNGEIQTELTDYFVGGFVDQSSSEITTIYEDYFDDQPQITVYNWDPKLRKLDKRIVNFDFASTQERTEELIFQTHDFYGAVLYINKFIIQAPPEPRSASSCYSSKCGYYPEWYRPYFRYLLALSYEMAGQTDQARDTYFALWQEYPDNIFGLASEHRLELVNP